MIARGETARSPADSGTVIEDQGWSAILQGIGLIRRPDTSHVRRALESLSGIRCGRRHVCLTSPRLVYQVVVDGLHIGFGENVVKSTHSLRGVNATTNDQIKNLMGRGIKTPEVRQHTAPEYVASRTVPVVEHLACGNLPAADRSRR